MFFFGLPALIINVLLLVVVTMTPCRDRSDNFLQVHEPEPVSGAVVQSGILISMADEIPTKQIVEFKNLVMVTQSSGLPMDAMPAFIQEVQNMGANGVVNFRLEVITGPTPHQTSILYGNAVVVE